MVLLFLPNWKQLSVISSKYLSLNWSLSNTLGSLSTADSWIINELCWMKEADPESTCYTVGFHLDDRWECAHPSNS
jgi:hypothetical protein